MKLRVGARGRNRTGTLKEREILSLLCLPISPPGQWDLAWRPGKGLHFLNSALRCPLVLPWTVFLLQQLQFLLHQKRNLLIARSARRTYLRISNLGLSKEKEMRKAMSILLAGGLVFSAGLASAAGAGTSGRVQGNTSTGVVSPNQPNTPAENAMRARSGAAGDAGVNRGGRTGVGAGVENRFNTNSVTGRTGTGVNAGANTTTGTGMDGVGAGVGAGTNGAVGTGTTTDTGTGIGNGYGGSTGNAAGAGANTGTGTGVGNGAGGSAGSAAGVGATGAAGAGGAGGR